MKKTSIIIAVPLLVFVGLLAFAITMRAQKLASVGAVPTARELPQGFTKDSGKPGSGFANQQALTGASPSSTKPGSTASTDDLSKELNSASDDGGLSALDTLKQSASGL